MTWLLLTGAGLAAEAAVIVALGRTVTARYEAGSVLTAPPVRTAQSFDGGGVAAGRVDAVPGHGG